MLNDVSEDEKNRFTKSPVENQRRGDSLHLTATDQEESGLAQNAPFDVAVRQALARRGLDGGSICLSSDSVICRIVEEYGAMFVASDSVQVPPVSLFTSAEEVLAFQEKAGWARAEFGRDMIELQPAALRELIAARDEALTLGLDIVPRGGAEAARRGFDDSIRLWRSRCDPAIEHWCVEGRLTREHAETLRELPLREQVAAVLELESEGVFFSKDLSKSILRSVAAPGASQHLAMLAFDMVGFREQRVREVMASHGWFQTVLSDLPHFTFLGHAEKDLPALGLRKVEEDGQEFWIPNIIGRES